MPLRWAPVLRSVAIASAGLLAAGSTLLAIPTAHGTTSLELGIFEPGAAWDTSKIAAVQNQVGVHFQVAKWYQDWDESFDSSVPPRLHNAGYIPEVTWEPMVNGNGVAYSDVLAGHYDSYLTTMANQVKAYNGTLRINLAAEMNGDWSPYYVGANGNSPALFQSFWRYVVTLFRNQGANNVDWIWTPNVHYGESMTYASMYPGDAYVSYTGLDGYNWGTTQSDSEWQTFAQVFGSSYRDLVALTGKQILIMETASAEQGGSKADWITNMFATVPTQFPRIKGFTWFDENKETNWRIDSSQASIDAFRNGVNGTIVIPTPTPTPSAIPTPTPKPTATPTSTPTPKPTATPKNKVIASTGGNNTNGPTATPTPTPQPQASPSATATGVPAGVAATATVLVTATVPSTTFYNADDSRNIATAFSRLFNGQNPQNNLALLILMEAGLVGLFIYVGSTGRQAATAETHKIAHATS